MSYKFEAPDPQAGADVDFNFFDDPPDRHSPTNLGSSGKWKRSGSRDKDAEDKDDRHDRHNDSGKKAPKAAPRHRSIPKNNDRDKKSDSHSDSYYSDDSDDTSDSRKQVRKIQAKIPTAGTESSKTKSTRDSIDDERNDKPQRQRKRSESPTTASSKKKESKKHEDSNGRRKHSHSYSSDSAHSKSSFYTDSDYSTTDSDSDVTDVSPLNSPHTPLSGNLSKRSQESRSGRPSSGKPPKSPFQKEVTFRQEPSTASSNRKHRPLIAADSDNIDLKLLMQAVIEMEQGRSGHMMDRSPPHSTHMAWTPQNKERKNMSFSNDGVRTIDRENQRLMQQIMMFSKQAKQKKKAIKSLAKQPPSINTTGRMSTAAINRNKEQRRIERENQAMLHRLQKAKPTTYLAKDNLMTDYQQKVLFGCSVAEAHPTPKKKSATARSPSPYVVPFDPKFNSKSRSMTNLHGELGSEMSGYSASSNTKRQRPVSATTRPTRPSSAVLASRKRPQSAKVQGSNTSFTHVTPGSTKPAWDDRW